MDEFEVEDQQREAALAYLRDEHARGAFDVAELERRTSDAQQARTVAELLAATATVPPIGTGPSPTAVAKPNSLALIAGIGVAILLLLVLVTRLA